LETTKPYAFFEEIAPIEQKEEEQDMSSDRRSVPNLKTCTNEQRSFPFLYNVFLQS